MVTMLPTSASDGILFEVELMCEPHSGCGVSIIGSRSSGIAIKSLLPGGIADQVCLQT